MSCRDTPIAFGSLKMTNNEAIAANQELLPLAESLWSTSAMAGTGWGGPNPHGIAGCDTESHLPTRRFCSLSHGNGPPHPGPLASRCSRTWVEWSATLPHLSHNNLSHKLSPLSLSCQAWEFDFFHFFRCEFEMTSATVWKRAICPLFKHLVLSCERHIVFYRLESAHLGI